MKSIRYFILMLSVVLIGISCKKVDEFTQFDMTFDESLTLPAFPLIINEPIPFDYAFSTNIDDLVLVNNTSKDLIEEAKLKEASFKVVNPADATFGFLKSVSFYLSTDGLNKVLIASKDPVSNTIGGELVLDIEDQDLTEYLKKDEVTLTIEIATDEIIEEELDLIAHMIFSVDAKILGI